MNSEESRLRTYAHWPENAPVDARRIAAAGFYYMGQGLEVQCFSCGGRISEWNIGDSVMSKHRVLDPFCPFVQNPILSGNIPLISDRRNSPNTSQENQSVYQNEKSRLDTFTAWPIRSIVSPELLVKSGFYYTQLKDKVRCAYCQGVVEKWEVGDDPDIEHRRLFPNCSFIRNKMLSDMNIAHQSGISIRNSDVDSIEANYESLKELGVQDHRIPRHGKFSTYDSRLNTFSQWPPSLTQKPHDLAEAGFYFTGRGDQVRCFHCDGGLRLWEREDDPWLEHARWFPHCGFLLLIKGQEFVDEARAAGVQNSVGPNYNDVKTREESPLRRIHSVTEQQLQDLMNTPFVIATLQMGIEASRVKQALRQRMESVGVPFSTPEALVVAALEIQTEQLASAEGEHWATPPNSPSREHWRRRGSPIRDNHSSSSEDESEEDAEEHECSQVQPKEAETPPSVEPTPPHEDCISNTPQVNSPGFDTCGPFSLQIQSCGDSTALPENPKLLESPNFLKTRPPSFPDYATIDARLRSYDTWPISLKLKPKVLSEAGFFYTGKGDQTICYHCGGGLKDWEETDEPWVEHARWFSKCPFVLTLKGKAFVEEVCGKKAEEDLKSAHLNGLSLSSSTGELEKIQTFTPCVESHKSINERNDEESSAESSSSGIGSRSSSRGSSDVLLCKICYTEEVGAVFLPCGHMMACVKCALSLSTCAICRKPVTAFFRAFVS